MEHLIITEIDGKYVKITAEFGYKVFSLRLNRTVRNAVVESNQVDKFKAVVA